MKTNTNVRWVFIGCLLGSTWVNAGQDNNTHSFVVSEDRSHFVQTDRYTLSNISARSDQIAPLEAVVSVAFGDDVKYIGQAINELLEGSGYTWLAPADSRDALLNDLSLPVVNRDLGPIKLRDALAAVTGKAWRLEVDELNRHVWFAVASEYQSTPVPEADSAKASSGVSTRIHNR